MLVVLEEISNIGTEGLNAMANTSHYCHFSFLPNPMTGTFLALEGMKKCHDQCWPCHSGFPPNAKLYIHTPPWAKKGNPKFQRTMLAMM